jgi:hypothetical protein
VIEQAFAEGVARTTKFRAEGASAHVRSKMWEARYLPFVRA